MAYGPAVNFRLGARNETNAATNAVNRNLRSIGTTAASLFGGFAAYQGGGEFATTALELERLRLRAELTFGQFETGAQTIQRVSLLAQTFGVGTIDLATGYTRFATALRLANVSLEDTERLFKGITAAAAAAGVSQEQIAGLLLAIEQISSKGALSGEELKQIAERLPGTYTLAANALGVTTIELNRLLRLGAIASNDFLPKFGRALLEQFAEPAEKATATAGAAFGRLNDQIKLVGSEAVAPLLAQLRDLANIAAVLLGAEVPAEARQTSGILSLVDAWQKYIDALTGGNVRQAFENRAQLLSVGAEAEHTLAQLVAAANAIDESAFDGPAGRRWGDRMRLFYNDQARLQERQNRLMDEAAQKAREFADREVEILDSRRRILGGADPEYLSAITGDYAELEQLQRQVADEMDRDRERRNRSRGGPSEAYIEFLYAEELAAERSLQVWTEVGQKSGDALYIYLTRGMDGVSEYAQNVIFARLSRLAADFAGRFLFGLLGKSSNPLLSAIGSFLGDDVPGRQHGGPVRAGELYRVNEAGVELFRPDVNGFIFPHGASTGGFTLHYYASPIENNTFTSVEQYDELRWNARQDAVADVLKLREEGRFDG